MMKCAGMPLTPHLLTVSLLALVPTPANANAIPPNQTDDQLHRDAGEDIVVTAPFQREWFAMPAAVAVLEGADLMRDLRPSLGETLARQPGVTTSFFGPGASRPILRGMDADRVRILTDGIGSFDVSSMSADHAVALNPLTADRIEVIRGPASLLYGSSAIGGVVNLTDHRITREVPLEWAHIDLSAALASAASERSLAGLVDLPLGNEGLVAHADGSFQQAGDYLAGGYIYSRTLRDKAEVAGMPEVADTRGRVPNSDSRTWQAAAGLSWIDTGGNLGFSVSRLSSNYGIPNRLVPAAEDQPAPEEDVRIDMRQTRVDVRGELVLSGAFDRITTRFGWADYRHDELEQTGEIGASFLSKGLEGRMELVQRAHGGWKGASGLQYIARRLQAVGEEAAIPANQSTQLGLFTVQSKDFGAFALEAGARYEHASVQSAKAGFSRSFDAWSGSIGVSVPLADGVRLSASLTHAERAPSPEELLTDGPHMATMSYEVGNPDLLPEHSHGFEAVLRGRGGGWHMEVSGFFNRFHNYIYLAPTADINDGLPVFAYRQADARYWGMEAEGSLRLAEPGDFKVDLTGLVDFVRADLLGGGGSVPRIPPLRFIAGLEAEGDMFGGRLEAEHATRQGRVAASETPTDGWTMLNASVTWRPWGKARQTAIVASLNNLTGAEARRHSSVLKDVAPLPGRDFRLSARFTF